MVVVVFLRCKIFVLPCGRSSMIVGKYGCASSLVADVEFKYSRSDDDDAAPADEASDDNVPVLLPRKCCLRASS